MITLFRLILEAIARMFAAIIPQASPVYPTGILAKSADVDVIELAKTLKSSSPLLDDLKTKMGDVLAKAVDAAGEKRELNDDEQATYKSLEGLADAEIIRLAGAQKSQAQADADKAKLDAINLIPSGLGGDNEPFETGTSKHNELSPGVMKAMASMMTKASTALEPAPGLGDMLVDDDAFKKATGEAAVVKGSPISVNTGVMMKTLVTAAGVGAVGTRVALQDQTTPRRFGLLDAITMLETGSETLLTHIIDWDTNAAATVAEGAAKPESALSMTPKTLTLSKIAHHIPVTTEALQDHPRLRGIINSVMVRGVMQRVEAKVAEDLAAWPALAVQSFSNNMTESILKAKMVAMANGTPSGILLSETDYETLALTRGSTNDHYISPGPFGPAMFTVWGLPVFPTTALPAGFGYVGDLSLISWNQRTPITLAVGWSGTDFIDNVVRILAEQRGMTDVMNNLAVVKTDLAAA